MTMTRISVFFTTCFLCLTAAAQLPTKVYPTNWWTGMKHSTIEVMIRGEGVGEAKTVAVHYPGVSLVDWHRVENPHYLFIHLKIAPSAAPGTVKILLPNDREIDFPLYARRKGNGT